jgi:hypothetical protein
MLALGSAALWLSLASGAVIAWSIRRAWPSWRFDRLALRGFDSPGEHAGPFRAAEPELRALYGFERDPGSVMVFGLQLLACLGGVAALATTLWCAVALVSGMPNAANTVAAFAGLCAAVLAIPMWLGHRLLHGLLAIVVALFVFGLWPPAMPLLLVIAVVQHDLIKRRAVADAREQTRRREHERQRTTPST